MRAEKLMDAIGEVRDELVDEAARDENLRAKRPAWMRYGALAAALALVIGAGGYILPRLGMGGASSPGASAGGAGSDGGSVFMSYEGPVLPLTLAEENEAITAQRDITLDFALWEPVWISNEAQLEEARSYGATAEELARHAEDLARIYPEGGYYDKGTDLLVTDEYVLTNSTNEPQNVEILYPFVSSLGTYREETPTLLVDGAEQEAEIVVGDYVGAFQGVLGGEEAGGSLNLDPPDSWEDYKTALRDGSYQAEAFDPAPDLTEIPAVLYAFTDPWGPEEGGDVPNPSIRVSYELDYDKTTILSYGFHSGSFDPDSGRQGRGFSIPQSWQRGYGQPYYLIVVGEDVANMTTECFITGGWDDVPAAEGGVTVTRTETTLDDALRKAAAEMVKDGGMDEADFERQYEGLCRYLVRYGVLAKEVIERYDFGTLESLDHASVDRVIYLKRAVTVPAGGSVTVTAELVKQASFDYACTGSDNVGVSGYDAVTTLGSVLSFERQRATLEDRGQIEIVRENFGFDLETGVTDVELDVNVEHYYIEVRRK